jgi:hypothetical protein
MGFVTIEDIQGSIELVIFPRTWEKVASIIEIDKIVLVDGRLDLEGAEPKVLVDTITTDLSITTSVDPSPSSNYPDWGYGGHNQFGEWAEPEPVVEDDASGYQELTVESLPAPSSAAAASSTADQSAAPDASAVPEKIAALAAVAIDQVVTEQLASTTEAVHPAAAIPPASTPEILSSALMVEQGNPPFSDFGEEDLEINDEDPFDLPFDYLDQWGSDGPPPADAFLHAENALPSGIQNLEQEDDRQANSGKKAPLSEIKPVETFATPTEKPTILPPFILSPHPAPGSESVHMITVVMRSTGDKTRDVLRMRRIHGTVTSYPGNDRFAIHIFERNRGYLVEFPNLTTGLCPELVSRLTFLMGTDNVRVETITFQ